MRHNLMSKMLKVNFEKKSGVILTGDFNMPKVDWREMTCKHDPPQEQLMQTISNLALEQLIHVPTHKYGNILDILAVSQVTEIENLQVLDTKDVIGKSCSDHFLVRFNLNVKIKVENLEKEIWMHDKADWHHFRWRLGQVPWNYIEQDSPSLKDV